MWVLIRCTGLAAAPLCPQPQIYLSDSPFSPSFFSLNPHQWAQTAKFRVGMTKLWLFFWMKIKKNK